MGFILLISVARQTVEYRLPVQAREPRRSTCGTLVPGTVVYRNEAKFIHGGAGIYLLIYIDPQLCGQMQLSFREDDIKTKKMSRAYCTSINNFFINR